MFDRIPVAARKITLVYVLLQFFYYFTFFWLIQNVYFLEQGINYSQLAILLGVWSITTVVLEIPSGLLADRFGRKRVIIIGKLAFFMGILTFALLRTFPGFLLGMVFWGIHESFISGALEALVFDELKSQKNEGKFKDILALATVSREVGLGVGVLIAGFVTQISMSYNVVASLVITFIGFCITFFLPNPKMIAESESELLEVSFSVALKQILSKQVLVRLVLFSITVMLSYQVITEYVVFSLKDLGLNYIAIGIFAFVEMLSFSIGAYFAGRVNTKIYRNVFALLSIAMAIGMFLITTNVIYIVVAAWLFLRIVKAFSEVSSTADWQSSVRSSDRATTGSIKNLLTNILYIPAAFVFGVLADNYGLFSAFYFSAVISLIYLLSAPFFARFKYQHHE
jgi:MFS family permease